TLNLIGPFGAHVSDVLLQAFGFGAYLFPCLIFALGWKWIRSEATEAPVIKLIGSATLVASACGLPRCFRNGACSITPFCRVGLRVICWPIRSAISSIFWARL